MKSLVKGPLNSLDSHILCGRITDTAVMHNSDQNALIIGKKDGFLNAFSKPNFLMTLAQQKNRPKIRAFTVVQKRSAQLFHTFLKSHQPFDFVRYGRYSQGDARLKMRLGIL